MPAAGYAALSRITPETRQARHPGPHPSPRIPKRATSNTPFITYTLATKFDVSGPLAEVVAGLLVCP